MIGLDYLASMALTSYLNRPPLTKNRFTSSARAGRLYKEFSTALVALLCGVCYLIAFDTTEAHAQSQASVQFVEAPFICDGGSRTLGYISGFTPGERVVFSSPQIGEAFSKRKADANGVVEMRWHCEQAKTWDISVVGAASFATTQFTLQSIQGEIGAQAPLGTAFDARSAPSLEFMQAWKAYSPFNAVGIYIPVNSQWDNRADKAQENLTSSWVSQVIAAQWRVLPIYVAHQAPEHCRSGHFVHMSADPATARSQGYTAGNDAVDQASRLGIGPTSPIFVDIEAYTSGCSQAVVGYMDGWSQAVKARGYLAGVYGSEGSTIKDLIAATRRGAGFNVPDAVWISTSSHRAIINGIPTLPDDLWPNARIHQYRLNVQRSYGGHSRLIDENMINSPVAVAGSVSVPPNTPTPPVPTATTVAVTPQPTAEATIAPVTSTPLVATAVPQNTPVAQPTAIPTQSAPTVIPTPVVVPTARVIPAVEATAIPTVDPQVATAWANQSLNTEADSPPAIEQGENDTLFDNAQTDAAATNTQGLLGEQSTQDVDTASSTELAEGVDSLSGEGLISEFEANQQPLENESTMLLALDQQNPNSGLRVWWLLGALPLFAAAVLLIWLGFFKDHS